MANQQGNLEDFVAPVRSWGAAAGLVFYQYQLNGFDHQTLPAPPPPPPPPPPATTAVAPGPDDRVPDHANQIAPPPEASRPSTKRGATSPTDYRWDNSTHTHDFEIMDDPVNNGVGGLQPGMHFWLRFETNGTTIEEHMAFVRVITVNNHKEMEFDRYDGNYNRTLYGSFKAMGLLVKHLAANHWTNTDTTGRMRYAWWHIYDNANYAVTPANHGNYLGDLATFRRNFCLRNGLAGQ